MKILLYDNSMDEDDLSAMISNFPEDSVLKRVTTYEECVKTYTQDEFDSIFIDFTDDTGSQFLSYIQENNPNQKIVTLSDKVICSEPRGCEYCIEHFNKIGLMKPFTDEDILYAISDVSFCQKFVKYGELINIVKDIDHRFDNFIFDSVTNTFINKNDYLENREEGLDSITSELTLHNIEFEIDNNHNIVILNLKEI